MVDKEVKMTENIGKKLLKLRLEAGLSQEDIASRIPVRRETLEDGKEKDTILEKFT